MQTKRANHLHDASAKDILSEDKIYLGIINKWLHNFFHDNNPASAIISKSSCSDLSEFTASAEELLRNKNGKVHTMVVFDCKVTGGTSAPAASNDLIPYLGGFLQSHLGKPHLFSRLQDDTFLVLLEDCKEIDIAVFAICLMEEISGRYPSQRAKLTFGTCKADPSEYNIHSLYRKAAYAKNTIKEQEPQLLADYHELVMKSAANA